MHFDKPGSQRSGDPDVPVRNAVRVVEGMRIGSGASLRFATRLPSALRLRLEESSPKSRGLVTCTDANAGNKLCRNVQECAVQ